jgi:hypothetical protein
MKKQYTSPALEMLKFEFEEVISDSIPNLGTNCPTCKKSDWDEVCQDDYHWN